MSPRPRRRTRGCRRGVRVETLAIGLALVAGAGLIALGAREITADLAPEQRYEQLRRRVQDQEAYEESHDQSGRFEMEPLASAWIKVGGTTIDYPVAQASSGDPDFYLTHDLWGEETRTGCPYLDARCTPLDAHRIIYAHHIGTTQLQFSPIADAWRQDRFDQIGNATLVSRNAIETYAPLCARVVDKQFAPIQRFCMSQTELQGTLREIAGEADSLSPDANTLIGRAEKAITLVTCASQQGGQRERTLLVFVSPDP